MNYNDPVFYNANILYNQGEVVPVGGAVRPFYRVRPQDDDDILLAAWLFWMGYG